MTFQIYDFVHLNTELLEELKEKREILNESAFSEKMLREAAQEALQRDALNHSYWMEVAKSEDKNQTEQDIYTAHRKGIEDILEAWEFSKTLDINLLDATDIESINAILNPHDIGIRKGMVRIKGSKIPTPNPVKVPQLLDQFCQELHSIEEPIKKALYAQSRLPYIHPFNDGNGRTSRLISNLILRRNGYTPIKLSKEEKHVYVDLLQLGFAKYAEREATGNPNALIELSEEEIAYYDFLGGKLNTSMSNAIKTLGDIRELHIEPQFKDNKTDEGLYRMIVKQLHLLREDNPILSINYDSTTREIYVKGNIDSSSIDMLLRRNPLVQKYKIRDIK